MLPQPLSGLIRERALAIPGQLVGAQGATANAKVLVATTLRH